MNLLEVLRDLDDQNPDATIWIEAGRPRSPESRVLLAPEPDVGGSPDPAFEYFIEVFVIRDTFEGVWPDVRAFAERVIHYAEHDA